MARLARRWILVFCQVEAAMKWRTALEAAGAVYVTTASMPAPTPATANAPQETTDTQAPGPPSDTTIDGIGDVAASVAPVNERRRGTKR
jgi:hypothetical protein